MTMPTLVDFKELTEKLENDADLVSEVLAAFVEDVPARMAKIRAAVDSRDMGTVFNESHTLKGMCAALRINSLAALAGSMQKSAETGDAESLRGRLSQLEEGLKAALSEIENYFATASL